MDWHAARSRFSFLARALRGDGGFAPTALAGLSADGRHTYTLQGPSELVRYPRESDEKYASRNALATYENHLRSACVRFVSFLSRRRPLRDGVAAPLPALMLGNADLRGTNLDVFWSQFALAARARGSMLLILDMPSGKPAASLGDQLRRRAVPYISAVAPEQVEAYELDEESGLFLSVSLACVEQVDGALQACTRDYTTSGWSLRIRDRVIASGDHALGVCPVLAFTESGEPFPVVGKYAQIADMSRRIFNARSELDEILRGQTFSLLTLQVPPEQAALFDAARTAATIGTHSMLVHGGDTPAFIAPDAGPAQTYQATLEELQQAIRRTALDESTERGAQSESGLSRRLRFEALNAELATFAQCMESLERRVWALWHRALGLPSGVTVSWPTDFNLVDSMAELDILTAMQATGFPPQVLVAKRATVVGAEFDGADADLKAALLAAVDEQSLEEPRPPGADESALGDQSVTEPGSAPAVDLSQVTTGLAALGAKIDALQTTPTPSPVINITVPEQPPAQITINPPQITVEAPQVTVNPPQVTVEAPQITVEAAPVPAPAPITLNTGAGARVIDLVRDGDGRVTGAAVREA